MSHKYCLIDIGTNNVLLLLAKLCGCQYTVLKRLNRVSALGAGMVDGFLQADGINRLKEILSEYIELAQKQNAIILLIGTCALREAKNADLVTNWLREKYHLNLRVISGLEEARYNGITVLDQFEHQDMLLFDIGGGSTEFTLINKRKIIAAESIPLGIWRVNNQFPAEIARQQEYAQKQLHKLNLNLSETAVMIGIGGTVSTLAALIQKLEVYDEMLVQGFCITQKELEQIYVNINTMPDAELARRTAFNPVSRQLLASGTMIVREIIARFSALDFFVTDRTWQFGVLLEIMKGSRVYE